MLKLCLALIAFFIDREYCRHSTQGYLSFQKKRFFTRFEDSAGELLDIEFLSHCEF